MPLTEEPGALDPSETPRESDPLSPDEERTTVASSSRGSTLTSGVPSSRQKLRCSSVKVLLQVGQRFTISLFRLLAFTSGTLKILSRFSPGWRLAVIGCDE